MPSFNSKNIIVGAAAVYISNEDSLSLSWPSAAVPAGSSGNSITSDLDSSADWRSQGYTSEGIEFTYTPDYGEVTVDQLLDAAKMFKQKMTAMVKTTLVETTLENLMVSWAQSAKGGEGLAQTYYHNRTGEVIDDVSANGTGFEGRTLNTGDEELGIAAGALGIEPVERQMVFVGPSPRTAANKKRERVYHLRRVLSVSASAHSIKRDAATMFPVEFRLLPSEVSGAEYGSILDRVITFTP